jgi:hypothetical protein
MREITDKERLDMLQALTDKAEYTGIVVLRLSVTGRGWRLHETSKPEGSSSVREAIDNFMRRQEENNE